MNRSLFKSEKKKNQSQRYSQTAVIIYGIFSDITYVFFGCVCIFV